MHNAAIVAVLAIAPLAAEPETNIWTKLDNAVIEGRRWDVPLVYEPVANRFLVLGGRLTWGDQKKPRSYDELALDLKEGRWENWFPVGKKWGPRLGPCTPPAWKNENWEFRDVEGNTRPNWTVYGTFSIGTKYGYDPEGKRFIFYAGGKTFAYDPSQRTWTDLNPATHPEKELGGKLLWGSMCYDNHNKRFVLFGGGNVQTPRGDPGTWTYTPATNTWRQLALDKEPPQRANSRLVYDPIAKKVVLFGGDQLNKLLADTWVFDVVKNQWEERKPLHSPPARAGHALLWLPKSKKIVLVGGYRYTSTTDYCATLYRCVDHDFWEYDTQANTWSLLVSSLPPEGTKQPEVPANAFVAAAVDEDDRVLLFAGGTWLRQVPTVRVERNKPHDGSVETRGGSHDPAWFREDVPAADPDKLAVELKNLPANRWALRSAVKRPLMNMDWGRRSSIRITTSSSDSPAAIRPTAAPRRKFTT